MDDKADWCDANVRHFIDIYKGEIYKGEIENGNMPSGIFTRNGWKNLRAKKKLDSMKKEYTWFMELKNSAISLGWNEAKQTVDFSKEWWDEHLDKGIKCNYVRFGKQGPKNLDDLHILFDKFHVSGATAT
ncbi:hypothetical protein PVAP13_2KG218758 [Panicum virgatum]|uniref:Myb/SANT-like domain-containing protein n=1 Tax=Panicum virgatum TaxID=38727 RepID=A0A8T0W0K7_PANVG|nr:hypothetical protein PVAP13_2KG218758 [Panicum virgatum]